MMVPWIVLIVCDSMHQSLLWMDKVEEIWNDMKFKYCHNKYGFPPNRDNKNNKKMCTYCGKLVAIYILNVFVVQICPINTSNVESNNNHIRITFWHARLRQKVTIKKGRKC